MIAEAFATLFSALTLSGSHPKDPAIARMLAGGASSSSGVKVTPEKVLALPAIKRAVQIITDKIFGLPWYVWENTPNGRQYLRDHPAWRCVNWMANPLLSAPACRQILTQYAMTRGNGCAWIDRSKGYWELYPLNPDETKPIVLGKREAELMQDQSLVGELRIGTKIGGQPKLLPVEDVYHIKGFGQSPYWGVDLVDAMAETFGGAIAKESFSNKFFGQGANPVGFITMDGSLDEESEETYMKSLKSAMEGLGNAHKIILLEDGAKFQPITIDPQKSQMLESKQFDVRMLAMTIGIKPHKLIDSANAAFASLEQANSEHNDDDIMPWINKHRAESDRKLLRDYEGEQGTHCIDCDDEELIYIPYAERASAAVNLVNNGITTRDEEREKLRYAPSGTPRGSQYRIPANINYEGDGDFIGGGVGGSGSSVSGVGGSPSGDKRNLTTAESVQKIYLGVGKVITSAEAREIVNKETGAELEIPGPDFTSPANQGGSSAFVDHSDVAKAYLDKIETRLTAQARAKAKDVKAFLEWLDNLKAEEGPASIQAQINELYVATIKRLNTLAETATTPEELQNAI